MSPVRYLGLAAVLILNIAFARAETGIVYEMNGKRDKKLFDFKRTVETDGDKQKITAIYTDPSGKEAVVEKVELEKGKVRRYSLDQKQAGETGLIEVVGGKVNFSYTQEGETDTDDEDLEENFVIPPVLIDYLGMHWQEILDGKDVKVRLGAVARKETVGFKLFKDGTAKVDAEEAIVVKMKATSPIIAAIVDPIFLTISKDGKRLLERRGRTPLKYQDGKKWKDLDAEVIHSWAG